mgnify:CR=1 FL=1
MKKGLLIAILVLCVLLLAAGGVLLYLNSIRQDPMQAFAPATPLPTQTPQPPRAGAGMDPHPLPNPFSGGGIAADGGPGLYGQPGQYPAAGLGPEP